METPNPESQAQQIKDAIFAGRKIEAIKLYREQTRSSLVEAKAAVERLEGELRASAPQSFSAVPQNKGCARTAAVMIAAATAGVWLLLRS